MSENHVIGSGLTEGELSLASFWVRNHILLRKVTYWSLVVINVGLWGFAAWGLLDAFAISYPRESRITADIANNQFLATQLQSNRPLGIQPESVSVFQATDKRLDFVVPIHNPNTDWWAEFLYRFNVSGELTPQRSGFILPGEQTYLGEFGFTPTTAGARSGALTVDNIRWHRTDPSIVGGDFPGWLARRNAFRYDNVQYSTDLVIGTKRVSRTSFTMVNPTAYGYWSVKLYVVLKRGSAPVATTTITVEKLAAGESRPIAIDWFDQLPGAISSTEVVAVVNYFDPSAYLPTTPLKE